MKKVFQLVFFLLLLHVSANALTQTAVSARLDTNSILVGDQVNLYLEASWPEHMVMEWPVVHDTITRDIEILRSVLSDSVFDRQEKMIHAARFYTITVFDSGYYAIPPFRFRYRSTDDTTARVIETRPLLLSVFTVPVDVSAEIRDIKGPVNAPFTFREALPWLVGIVLLAGLAYLVFKYIQKRRRAEPLFVPFEKPAKPHWKVALDALEELRQKKLWQNGMLKDYFTELTEIVRTYLLGQFNIHALESTTHEILHEVEQSAINGEPLEKLRKTLLLADLVKFAKENPSPLDNDMSLIHVIDFVRETYHLSETLKTEEDVQNV
jgi:hypothetical protein